MASSVMANSGVGAAVLTKANPFYAGAPLSPISMGIKYAPYALSVGWGLIMVFVSMLFVLYITFLKPVFKVVMKTLRSRQGALDKVVQKWLMGKFSTDKTKHVVKPAVAVFTFLFIETPWNFLMGLLTLVLNIASHPILIIVGIIGMYFFLALEKYESDMVEFGIESWKVTRSGSNVVFSGINGLWDASDIVVRPMYNPAVENLFSWGLIVGNHVGKWIEQGDVIAPGFTGRPETSGRRLMMEPVINNDPGFHQTGIADSDVAGFGWFPAVAGPIEPVMDFAGRIVTMLGLIVAILLDGFLTIIDAVPEVIGLFFEFIQLPMCFFMHVLCGLGEVAYIGITLFVLVPINLIISFFSFFGIPKISASAFDFIRCSSPDANTSPAECHRCNSAFPMWKCATVPTRRVLVSCVEETPDVWLERITLDEETRRGARHSDVRKACPLTYRSTTPHGNWRNLAEFVEYTKKVECYHVAVNGTVTMEVCPPEENERRHLMTTVSHSIHDRRVEGTEMYHTPRGRRSLTTSDAISNYVSSVFKKAVRVVERSHSSKDLSSEPKKVTGGITLEAFRGNMTNLSAKYSGQGIFKYDELKPPEKTPDATFNAFAHVQTLILKREVYPTITNYLTQKSATNAAFYNDMGRRLQENRPTTYLDTSIILNRFVNSLDMSARRGEVRRRMAAAEMDPEDAKAAEVARESRRRTLSSEAEGRKRRLEALRRNLATNLIPIDAIANSTCPDGYTACPDGIHCEVESETACVCPPMPPSNTTHTPVWRRVQYSLYDFRCSLKQTDFLAFGTDTVSCWKKYLEQDANNPMDGILGKVGDTLDPTKPVRWCPPLMSKSTERLPRVTFDLKKYVEDTCGQTSSVVKCVCPEYLTGTFEYNAWWLEDVALYEHDRFYNGMLVWKSLIGAVINTATFGIVHWLWSHFWGIFPLISQDWVNLFDERLTSHDLSCTFFHLGSFFYVVFFVVLYIVTIISFEYAVFRFWYKIYLAVVYVVTKCNRPLGKLMEDAAKRARDAYERGKEKSELDEEEVLFVRKLIEERSKEGENNLSAALTPVPIRKLV